MAPDPTNSQGLGAAVNEISERASLLVREEIELAKAEVTEKLNRLIKGAVVGLAAGIFAVVGLLFLLHSLAWGLFEAFFDGIWLGYLVTAAILFVLGGLAGFLAARAVKAGAPPTPDMAIDEAKKIRATVTASDPMAVSAAGTVTGPGRDIDSDAAPEVAAARERGAV